MRRRLAITIFVMVAAAFVVPLIVLAFEDWRPVLFLVGLLGGGGAFLWALLVFMDDRP